MIAPGLSPQHLQSRFSGILHNSSMTAFLKSLMCLACLLLAGLSPLQAQESQGDADADSTEVEESDEAYRRRMELEDARQRDLGYTLPAQTYAQKQEKLDKLPEESRDNIRDQLVDIIVENGEWEPSDALKEYPYEPTVAATANPELMEQEQEAWEEQIEKYHKREAAAFGTYLGPVPGPGNPEGEEGGGQQGDETEGSEQAGGQQGGGAVQDGQQDGEQDGGQDKAAGSYAPYQSNRSTPGEEVSTAGVQQSALDFLKGLKGQAPSEPPVNAGAATQTHPPAGAEPTQPGADSQAGAESTPQGADSQAAADAGQQNTASADAAEQQQSSERPVEIDLTTPGIIAIEDLGKLQGTEGSDEQQ